MDLGLRILCMVAGTVVFSLVFRLLLKRRMDEATSFVWLPLGIIALIVGFFPEAVTAVSSWINADSPATVVLILAIILLIFIVFKNTTQISEYKAQIHELSMNVSMLNSEVRSLIEYCKTLQAEHPPKEISKGKFERPL